jgi:hypothetical protein
MSKKKQQQSVHKQEKTLTQATGITPAIAAELDRGLKEMETGDPDGTVQWDESSETLTHLHPSGIGESSHAVHRGISSNSDMLFSALVQREKNADPDIEHEEAYDRAVEKLNAIQEGEGEEDE